MVDGIFRTMERPAETPGSTPVRCAITVNAADFHGMLMERLLAFANENTPI